LAWPAKNHVSASCANSNIPDGGTLIYAHGPNPTTEPTLATARKIFTFETNTAPNQYKGFQNCPKFCENQDKALCTGCFNLPTDLQSGAVYTFSWVWTFNPGEIYSSCWEARIEGNPVTGQPTQGQSQPGQGTNGCGDATFCATACGGEDKIKSCTCDAGQFQVECGGAVPLAAAVWMLAICFFALF
jgi:hypothetical protein